MSQPDSWLTVFLRFCTPLELSAAVLFVARWSQGHHFETGVDLRSFPFKACFSTGVFVLELL